MTIFANKWLLKRGKTAKGAFKIDLLFYYTEHFGCSKKYRVILCEIFSLTWLKLILFKIYLLMLAMTADIEFLIHRGPLLEERDLHIFLYFWSYIIHLFGLIGGVEHIILFKWSLQCSKKKSLLFLARP